MADHRGYVLNYRQNLANGAHFSLPGHSLGDLRVTIIVQARKTDELYRAERENIILKYYILITVNSTRRYNGKRGGFNISLTLSILH